MPGDVEPALECIRDRDAVDQNTPADDGLRAAGAARVLDRLDDLKEMLP